MSLIPIPTDDEANPLQKSMFEHSKKILGRVANAVRVGSHTPKLMQSLFGFIVSSLRQEITEQPAGTDEMSNDHKNLDAQRLRLLNRP